MVQELGSQFHTSDIDVKLHMTVALLPLLCVIFAIAHPSKMPKGSLRHWFLPECSFKTLTWQSLSFLCIRGEEMKLKSLHVWRREELRLFLSWVTISQVRKW